MEENKKPFPWKLNLFDLLVVAVAVLAVAAVVFLRYQQQRQQLAQEENQPGMTTVRYTIELTSLPLEIAQMIQPGDELTERTRQERMGTVESVSIGPTRAMVKDQYTGDFYFTDIPELYTATIVLVSTATADDRVIITEGFMGVRAGVSVRAYGPGYYGSGSILMVDRG